MGEKLDQKGAARRMFRVIRTFSRAPAAPGLAVGSLALALALATAMFAVVDAVVWRPIPVPAAGRLAELWVRDSEGRDRRVRSPLRDGLLKDGLPFADVEGYAFGSAVLGDAEEPTVIATATATAGLMSRLGITLLAGRPFRPDDAGATVPVILVRESLWRARFGGSSDLSALRVLLDGVRHEVVGVVPDAAKFPESQTAVWKVATPGGPLQLLAVVRTDVALDSLGVRLAAMDASWRQSGDLGEGESLVAKRPIQERLTDRFRVPLFTMFAATLLVLLGAVTNAVTLLLIRTGERQAEFATRLTLGLSRPRLFLSQALEGGLLGASSWTLGALFASGAMAVAASIQPPEMNFVTGARAAVNVRLLAFLTVTGFTAFAAMALAPAWRASRVGVERALTAGSRGNGPSDAGWTSALVCLQVAVTVLVLVTASVLTTSFVRQVSADRGFDPAGLTTVDVSFQSDRYAQPRVALELLRDVDLEVERAFPGIASTIAVGLPPAGGIPMAVDTLQIAGEATPSALPPQIPYTEADPDFFVTMGIPLVEGHTFTTQATDEIVVNEVMARRYWPRRTAVGQRVRFGDDQPWRTIVGVAKDVRHVTIADELGQGIEVYFPFAADQGLGLATLALRGPDSASAAAMIRARLRAADPDLPLTADTMANRLAAALWPQRFFVRIAVTFAVAAAAVTALGIYVVAAYRVRQRRHEMAVRIAVGATAISVAALVVRRALLPVAFGSGLGAVAAIGARPLIESLLFETSSGDPVVIAGVSVTLFVVVAVGTLRPALRAASTDPNSLLKSE
ncbi:MAG: ABC transporter permease [Vicinamibacterales bacterium]